MLLAKIEAGVDRAGVETEMLSDLDDDHPGILSARLRDVRVVEVSLITIILNISRTLEAERLGEPPHVRDLLLDHASTRGSGGDYDHWDYRDEKLAAMELWADYVERVVMPKGGRPNASHVARRPEADTGRPVRAAVSDDKKKPRRVRPGFLA